MDNQHAFILLHDACPGAGDHGLRIRRAAGGLHVRLAGAISRRRAGPDGEDQVSGSRPLHLPVAEHPPPADNCLQRQSVKRCCGTPDGFMGDLTGELPWPTKVRHS